MKTAGGSSTNASVVPNSSGWSLPGGAKHFGLQILVPWGADGCVETTIPAGRERGPAGEGKGCYSKFTSEMGNVSEKLRRWGARQGNLLPGGTRAERTRGDAYDPTGEVGSASPTTPNRSVPGYFTIVYRYLWWLTPQGVTSIRVSTGVHRIRRKSSPLAIVWLQWLRPPVGRLVVSHSARRHAADLPPLRPALVRSPLPAWNSLP